MNPVGLLGIVVRLPGALLRVYGAARTLKRAGFAAAWARFGQGPLGTRALDEERRRAWVRAVRLAGRLIGARCLPQTLALCALLREHGLAARPVLGIRREAERWYGHAWVEVEGRVLDETPDPRARFATLIGPETDWPPGMEWS